MKLLAFVKAPALPINGGRRGSKDLKAGILSSAKFSKIKYIIN
jgi:hypothetical protein